MLITRDEDVERASRALKAMSHPLRLKILCTLGLPASRHPPRQGHPHLAQGRQPRLLPGRRPAHAAADRDDARGVLLGTPRL